MTPEYGFKWEEKARLSNSCSFTKIPHYRSGWQTNLG